MTLQPRAGKDRKYGGKLNQGRTMTRKCRDCQTKRQGVLVEYLNGPINPATKLPFNLGQGMLIRKRVANYPGT